jgi:hypothetical protein
VRRERCDEGLPAGLGGGGHHAPLVGSV